MKVQIKPSRKKNARNAIIKIVEMQRIIHDHIREGKDLSELKKKGIRFAKPI